MSHEHENQNTMPATQESIGELQNVIAVALIGAQPEPGTPEGMVIRNKLGSEDHPADYSSTIDEGLITYSVCLWGNRVRNLGGGRKAVDETFEITKIASGELVIDYQSREATIRRSLFEVMKEAVRKRRHTPTQAEDFWADPAKAMSQVPKAPKPEPVSEMQVQAALERLRDLG